MHTDTDFEVEDSLAHERLMSIVGDAPIKFDMKLQGSTFVDPVLILGGKAGPISSYDNILHELAHYVEIHPARAKQPNWGLFLATQSSEDYQITHEPAQREIRTWAWEHVIREHLGIPKSLEEITRACAWVTDIDYYVNEFNAEKIQKRVVELVATEIEKYTEQELLDRLQMRADYLCGRIDKDALPDPIPHKRFSNNLDCGYYRLGDAKGVTYEQGGNMFFTSPGLGCQLVAVLEEGTLKAVGDAHLLIRYRMPT